MIVTVFRARLRPEHALEYSALAGDIAAQADEIYKRIGEILAAAGCSYSDVVSTRDFITTTEGYAKTATVRRKYFSDPFPAATGVIVAGLLRPGALIEIEAVAALPR